MQATIRDYRKNPDTYDAVVQQVNGTNTEIMARIRARLPREQNKGTTDAIVVEPETTVAP